MADERDRWWLDEAAAEKLLRGEPAEPVGPNADARARAEAARLRAALDALARPATRPHSPPGAELTGEAAAVAAFRAARARAGAGPVAAAFAEPLVDLGRVTPGHGSASRRAAPRRHGRTVRFGLAAALASVAVGGLAAAAVGELLDKDRQNAAGPAPAASLSVEEEALRGIGGSAPTLTPQLRPTPDRGTGASPGTTAGTPQTPGADGRPSRGAGATGKSSEGATATGGGGREEQGGQVGGTSDDRSTFGIEGDAKDRDRDTGQDGAGLRAVDLCKDFKADGLTPERRERLALLARGEARIPAYCESVLNGLTYGGGGVGSPGSDGFGQNTVLSPTHSGTGTREGR